jgi:adenosylcobinamide amidohydrolase
MDQVKLAGNNVKLTIQENVLSIISDVELRTVSSAIYNGGFKKTKFILNVQVPEGYSDSALHEEPLGFVESSSKKLGVAEDFVGMITAAKVRNYSAVSRTEGDLAVSVVATAGCSHAESAGEDIQVQQGRGTINIIVAIDGNPTDGCLTGTLLTATEAKTAALRALDVRSRYSGDSATGTVTDSIVAAATNKGPEISYGGPSSKLGQLIGYCTRKAVKEAVTKQDRTIPRRSVIDRLKERHLPIEKIASELSKIGNLNADEKALTLKLTRILKTRPLFAALLMSTVKIDEDIEKELIPAEFGETELLGQNIGDLLSKQACENAKKPSLDVNVGKCDMTDFSPFLKQVMISMAKGALLEESTESLK